MHFWVYSCCVLSLSPCVCVGCTFFPGRMDVFTEANNGCYEPESVSWCSWCPLYGSDILLVQNFAEEHIKKIRFCVICPFFFMSSEWDHVHISYCLCTYRSYRSGYAHTLQWSDGPTVRSWGVWNPPSGADGTGCFCTGSGGIKCRLPLVLLLAHSVSIALPICLSLFPPRVPSHFHRPNRSHDWTWQCFSDWVARLNGKLPASLMSCVSGLEAA